MSRLCNLIEAVQTGRVRVTPASPVITVEDEWNSSIEQTLIARREYRLQVKLAVRGYVDDTHSDDLARLKDMAKRQILEEIFGEFRPMIRKLERAIYEFNFDEARTALQELEVEMGY